MNLGSLTINRDGFHRYLGRRHLARLVALSVHNSGLKSASGRDIGMSYVIENLDLLSILYQTDIVQPYGPTRWIENLLPRNEFNHHQNEP